MVDTMSNTGGELNSPQSRQPPLSESLKIDEEQDEDFPSSSSRWQANEQLATFLDTSRKLSKSFERKTICGRSPRPDVDAAYTPMLEINSNPMDQYRVSGVFCGINEFNSFPPSTQIQKGQKGTSPTADQSHPNNQGTFQTPRTPHFLHPGCFPSKGVTCKVERQGNLALSAGFIT